MSQEELLLSIVIATAICTLLLSLLPERSQDYAVRPTACYSVSQWLLGMVVSMMSSLKALSMSCWCISVKRSKRILRASGDQHQLCFSRSVGSRARIYSCAQFACFFLICTTSLLKIRWLLGTAVLTAPLVLVYAARLLRGVTLGGLSVRLTDVLPHDADVHLTCAWATGALMSFLADSYRRCEARGSCL